jgi:hypothetical protein
MKKIGKHSPGRDLNPEDPAWFLCETSYVRANILFLLPNTSVPIHPFLSNPSFSLSISLSFFVKLFSKFKQTKWGSTPLFQLHYRVCPEILRSRGYLLTCACEQASAGESSFYYF